MNYLDHFSNVHENYIPSSHTHWNQEKKSSSKPKEEKKKQIKKFRKDNENKCSMKYLNHF